MHETKVLEVRDRWTLLVMMATKVANSPLTHWVGIAPEKDYVVVTSLNSQMECGANPYVFENLRTREAVRYIIENFDNLKDRDVVDIEFILGEVDKPKVSQWDKLNSFAAMYGERKEKDQ